MTVERDISQRRTFLAHLCAAVGGMLVVAWEIHRDVFERYGGGAATSEDATPLGWLLQVSPVTSLSVLLLSVVPAIWCVRRPLWRRRHNTAWWTRWFGLQTKPLGIASHAGRRAWTLAFVVGAVSWGTSFGVAQKHVGQDTRFGSLPPAYHDEYSYLFQARTFLAGRVAFSSHPSVPRIFDQMHVLNEGEDRFASRYFPGVGLWMAPFVAAGKPYWGHWLAGSLCAVFVFWAGRELGGNGVGFLAGLLTATSPGMALFSNLLLSHHPTLVGLSLFLFAFLRMTRRRTAWDAALAGTGLTFAMLCRPLTAAAVGLPFGLWFLVWLIRKQSNDGGQRTTQLTLAAALAVPLFVGLAGMFAYNRAITGSGWTTPYQVYTDIYTPRHVYGFNNVERGEQRLGPRVIADYDRWAENLTPSLAARNLGTRMLASWRWSLSGLCLGLAAALFPFLLPRADTRWWLVAGSIVCLHAAYVPYWYAGIMHWHYVFESGPLWLLIFAGSTAEFVRLERRLERPGMVGWWFALVAAAIVPTYFACPPLWTESRIDHELVKVAYSRRAHRHFRALVEQEVTDRPALVLVEFQDRHIDLVVNPPDLEGDILIGRLRPGDDPRQIARHFPERTCYVWDGNDGFHKLEPDNSNVGTTPS